MSLEVKTRLDRAYERAFLFASRENPDLKRARRLLEATHKLGHAQSSYALATWYLFGVGGLPKNTRKAISLLKTACSADVASAHFDLAVSYETGNGIRKNEQSAFRHYLAAAINGDNEAIYEVGRCYFYGIGTPIDKKVATIWFKKAKSIENSICKK
ncbi:tetratricopeptide repeat protein [Hydrogenophaga pseudoflava]|uniref:tetratricopeptide repeat protein n=1 Tax=Hydrogenophaga pseudoflava TaxID=47421 RepID=UPI0027E55A22|nr:tetratricopeptide repeat protein [Hydrogenophaga pseudoflava]MDQ7742753.1 tetratricopeptide repeat protein [Hydrogenophaga pseudoflava]